MKLAHGRSRIQPRHILCNKSKIFDRIALTQDRLDDQCVSQFLGRILWQFHRLNPIC